MGGLHKVSSSISIVAGQNQYYIIMARIFGLSGRITGRKGDAVFSVRKGEQIVRQYNPMVLNPNTEKQTVQRSKMKLSSQLGAIFANIIAIPSEGAKTPRNIFTKTNFALITRDNTQEGIVVVADLPKLQLTKSGRAMCPIVAGIPYVNGNLYVSLTQDCKEEYDRVVYSLVAVQGDGTMRVIASEVEENAGDYGRFTHQFSNPNGDVLVYAYGIKDLSSKAHTIFENTEYQSGDGVATLISSRTVSAADAQVSMTAGLLLKTTDHFVSSEGSEATFIIDGSTSHAVPSEPFFAIVDSTVLLVGKADSGYHISAGQIVCGAEDPIDITGSSYTLTVPAEFGDEVAQLVWTAVADA